MGLSRNDFVVTGERARVGGVSLRRRQPDGVPRRFRVRREGVSNSRRGGCAPDAIQLHLSV